jgi:DMSO/TMAO reductase YedYZ molybdopterin-dependent catalytic subunit
MDKRGSTFPSIQAMVLALRGSIPNLLAGFLGSLAAITVMAILRVTVGTPTPPELVGERLLPLMSADQFVSLLIRFQPHPKTGPLALALLGMLIIGIIFGPLYATLLHYWERHIPWHGIPPAVQVSAIIVVVLEGIAALLFWPVLQISVAGDPPATARLLTLLSLLLTWSSALITIALTEWWLRHDAVGNWAANIPDDRQGKISRRIAILRTASIIITATVLDNFLFNALLKNYDHQSNLAYEGIPVPSADATNPITPPADFYVVSKNVIDPHVDAGRWRLQIGGLTRKSMEWDYDQVRQLPAEERDITLECISNSVGGRLMSTARWRGTRLQTVLDAAGGALPEATYVVFTGVDSYTTSLPLKDLLEARAMLVWDMNGAPLPERHGFPLRLIAPGRYGEQSPKWLTNIELTDHEVKGFYQSQGWSARQLETTSRIDYPNGTVSQNNNPIAVGGIAFAGIREISKVEVSDDDGQTWQEAELLPPQSDQSWVFWKLMWKPTHTGMYTLTVRATDGTGTLQVASQRGTVPDGATGWHHVKVTVA